MLTHDQSAAAVVRASRTGPTVRPSSAGGLLDGVRRRRPRRGASRPHAPGASPGRRSRAVRRLPVLDARPSDSPGGRAVRRVLATRASYGVPGRLLGTAVLEVPPDADDYLRGRRAQTLRRKIRSAERRGLKVRRIDDDRPSGARWSASPTAPSRPTPTRRTASRRRATTTCCDHDVWLTVETRTGTPLLLSVTPHDGEFATLRYFRTLGRATRTATPATSPAARWSPSWPARRALPARHRHPARADQRAAALPADGGVPVRAGAAALSLMRRSTGRRGPSRRRSSCG